MLFAANAKVNLTLDIVRRRDDGFHDVKTVMRSVSLCDYIDLGVADKDSFVIKGADLPADGSNLCIKARDAFRSYTGDNAPVYIILDKRVPSQAGLGGGSSDAAAVLNLMNDVLHKNLGALELQDIAAGLGSDVAFFVKGGTALCTGRGEKIEHRGPDAPLTYMVIAKGGAGLSTPDMYRRFDASGEFDVDNGRSNAVMAAGTVIDIVRNVYNSFDAIATALCPDVAEIKSQMKQSGALCTLLSGSGSAVFGIYQDKVSADSAAEMLKSKGYFASSCLAL